MSEVKPKKAKKPVDLSREDKDPSFFDVPKVILEELKSKGLEHRWINGIKYQRDYGYHKNQWTAYKSEKKLTQGSLDFGVGVDTEGYVRRGDMILAVRTTELGDKHRARIDKKNKALQRFTKQAAEDLRQQTKGLGQVFEGYDENDGKDIE